MSYRSIFFLMVCTLCVGACKTRVGQSCEKAGDCGPGFDCYHQACARVCTAQEQCEKGSVCQRFRCLTENGQVPHALNHPKPPTLEVSQVPPPPDATVAELRALRYEISELRRNQERLIALLLALPQTQSEPAPMKPEDKPSPSIPKEMPSLTTP